MVRRSRSSSGSPSFLNIFLIMKYPRRKDDANNNPYHLIAKGPILKISGFGSHGMIRRCITLFLSSVKGRKLLFRAEG
jgi:hypothetical protein